MPDRKRTLIATLILAALAMACRSGVAADTLTLKSEAVVTGPKVLLGEVADITGDNAAALAGIEVAATPNPGYAKNLDASLVVSRLRSAGIDPRTVEINGAREVKAMASHMEISKEMLAESLRQYILREMPWDPADAEVEVPLPLDNVLTPDGEVTLTWRPNPQYRYLGPGAFRGTIAVDGKVQKTLLCKAIVEAYGEAVVAARDIPRGRIIGRQDLESKKLALSGLPTGATWEAEHLIGMVTRKTIFPGQFINTRDVEPRVVVKRNQLVTVEMRSSTVQVATRAKALMDGRAGDTITCANINSEEAFEGVVRGDGVVIVE
jgi:flagella basal body P-ring formation protein FlgA